jgi:hypothetical protein
MSEFLQRHPRLKAAFVAAAAVATVAGIDLTVVGSSALAVHDPSHMLGYWLLGMGAGAATAVAGADVINGLCGWSGPSP